MQRTGRYSMQLFSNGRVIQQLSLAEEVLIKIITAGSSDIAVMM
jgi:hypothetical protein